MPERRSLSAADLKALDILLAKYFISRDVRAKAREELAAWGSGIAAGPAKSKKPAAPKSESMTKRASSEPPRERDRIMADIFEAHMGMEETAEDIVIKRQTRLVEKFSRELAGGKRNYPIVESTEAMKWFESLTVARRRELKLIP